jgi:hypothetical protein
MGFRLSSAIAGFAERTSENLTALQDKADEITKTAAERYANEALQVRKERIKSVREYTRAAKELKNMGLNNAQIEVALSAGVAGVDNVKSSLANLEKREQLKDPSFKGFDAETQQGAINSLFKGLPEDATGRDIAEQAKIFASFESPMVAPDAKALGEQVAASTKTLFAPKGIDPEYTTAQFTAQAEAAGGKAPVDVEGDLGIAGATMQTVSDPVALMNALEIQNNLVTQGLQNKALELDNKFKQFSNPLLLKDLRQKLEIGEIQKGNLRVEGLLNNAKLASERIDLHLKRKFGTKKYEAELENLAAQTARTVAETGRPTSYEELISGMQWELSQIDAEKDPEKVALLKTKINEANLNYTAFELVGEDGQPDLTGLGSMQKLLGQIVTNKSAGKFVMGTDFLISETGDIIWKGEKEGQDTFNDIKREASKDFVDALAPNGQFVNEGARIAVTGLAGNMYKLMYPTETELLSMLNTEFIDAESDFNTGKSSLDDITNFVLQKLKVRNPDATLEDAKRLVSEAR